jgi:APA family basic amino acid/polyamine antiporter
MAFAVALVPVLFAYGGAHKTSYLAGEARNPGTSLVRGMLIGMFGVVLLYLLVNSAYLLALGAGGMAASDTPASDLMHYAFGKTGGTLVGIGISISALGLLSQAVLAAPRVLYAMAGDGLLFEAVSRVHSRTHAPVAAIVMQSVMTMIVAVIGRYDQILNYVIAIETVFLGLNAVCVFTLRRRQIGGTTGFRVPGHPYTTGAFILTSWLVCAATFYMFPRDGMIGLVIAISAIPVYLVISRRGRVTRNGRAAGDQASRIE